MSVPIKLQYRAHAGLRAAGWVWRHPGLTLAALYLLLNVVAVFAPEWLTRYDPLEADPVSAQLGSSVEHWLGTDQLGRDELSRLFWAARTDLTVGVLAVIFPFCFGTRAS